jgi:hypothetical protein
LNLGHATAAALGIGHDAARFNEFIVNANVIVAI